MNTKNTAYTAGKTGFNPSESKPVYSVVVPFYNEAKAAPSLLKEILEVFKLLNGPAECICIDDASSDDTGKILKDLADTTDSSLRVISFPKNRGQAAALYRGLLEARGEIVITMDGDGQNDPADIPLLLEQLKEADLVCGIRVDRQDAALRKKMSHLANAIRGRVLADGLRDSGCALKAMRRDVVQALLPIRTLYSFIPAQAAAAGFRVTEIPVKHRHRKGGESSYGLRAFAIMPLLDMLGLYWYRKRCILRTDDCMDPARHTQSDSS